MDSRIEIRPGRIINVDIHPHPSSNAAVFLIHGMGGRADQWHEQIDLLKENYTLIVPDLLGHGKSDKPKPGAENPYSFSEFNLDLQALFNKFSKNENIIIGHSYGGALAASLAIDHQDQISRLILLAPTPCDTGMQIPLVFNLPAFVLEWLRPIFIKKFKQLAFTQSADPELLAQETEAMKHNPMYMIKAVLNGIKHTPLIDMTMLTVPTLIILGKYDGVVPPTMSQQFYQAMPHHRFETINNVAHMIMMENPIKTNALIEAFLK